MTQQLSRRERKLMRRAGHEPAKPMVTVDTRGMKAGIAHIAMSIAAVFIFPIWMLYHSFREWKEDTNDNK